MQSGPHRFQNGKTRSGDNRKKLSRGDGQCTKPSKRREQEKPRSFNNKKEPNPKRTEGSRKQEAAIDQPIS